MRKLYLATGVIVATLTLAGGNASASDLNKSAIDQLLFNQRPGTSLFVNPEPPDPVAIIVKPLEQPVPKPKPPEPVKYVVLPGDNLTKIAAAHDTTWLRLWNKNEVLTNPDLIFPGQVFLIPDKNEKLKDRPVPAAVAESLSAAAPSTGRQTVPRGPVSGNTYTPGYCTWYVKNRRPDLPNGLGNANTWYSRAAAMGMAVGSTPRAGAVGTTTRGDYGHVVYVESVSGNTITISEMNYAGLYSQRTTTASAGDFLYIY
jgi:surface antigen